MARDVRSILLALGALGALLAFAFRPRSSGASVGPPSSSGAPLDVGTFMDPNTLTARNSTLAQRRTIFEPYFTQAELDNGIPAGLLLQQGIAESNLDPSARSSAGAVGLMQMMPRYFPGAGVDALADIDRAAKELARLYGVFGSWTLALAGYNAGQGAVQQYGGVPPFAETQDYVTKITRAAGISEPGVLWA